MGPKIEAACQFARNTGKVAVIGSLEQIEAIVRGAAGTRVSLAAAGLPGVKRAPVAPFFIR